jgi:hypothetical protein
VPGPSLLHQTALGFDLVHCLYLSLLLMMKILPCQLPLLSLPHLMTHCSVLPRSLPGQQLELAPAAAVLPLLQGV